MARDLSWLRPHWIVIRIRRLRPGEPVQGVGPSLIATPFPKSWPYCNGLSAFSSARYRHPKMVTKWERVLSGKPSSASCARSIGEATARSDSRGARSKLTREFASRHARRELAYKRTFLPRSTQILEEGSRRRAARMPKMAAWGADSSTARRALCRVYV